MFDPYIPTTNQEFRQMLCDAVLFRIQEDVNDLIYTLPDDFPDEVADQIRNEVVTHTQNVLDALTLQELVSDSAMERHIVESARTAQHLANWHLARRGR